MGGEVRGNFGNTRGSRSNAQIHQGRQDKHVKGTNNYNQQRANGKNPSILTSNPNKLLKDAVGKGQSYGNNKVVVDYDKKIGEFYDIRTGKYYDTTRATIHYHNKGNAHIVPAKSKWLK